MHYLIILTILKKKIMNETIFSEQVQKYITNEMSICINDLSSKILQDVPQSSTFFNDFFEYMMNIDIPYKYNLNNHSSRNNKKFRKHLEDVFNKFLKSKGFTRKREEIYIFDNICQCFINMKEGGIVRVYQKREAASWYPKIIINQFIGIKEDIDELDDDILIFRGTSKEEYDSNNFGQSWSLSKTIANKFAFNIYKHSEHNQNIQRVLLSTTIKKDAIFFYKNNGIEDEVIVDSKEISKNKVNIIIKKILN